MSAPPFTISVTSTGVAKASSMVRLESLYRYCYFCYHEFNEAERYEETLRIQDQIDTGDIEYTATGYPIGNKHERVLICTRCYLGMLKHTFHDMPELIDQWWEARIKHYLACCEGCHKNFLRDDSSSNSKCIKYCSRYCQLRLYKLIARMKRGAKIIHTCLNCSEEYPTKRSTSKYCSAKCRVQYNRKKQEQ